MFRMVCGSLVLSCLLGAAPPAVRPVPPPPLDKLYILHVFDTADEDLRPSLLRDEERMKALWRETIPPRRYELLTLKGRQVRGFRLSYAIRQIKKKITPRDGLVFIYGGHGALRENVGHVLRLDCGTDLVRAEVRRQLEGCKAGLTVMLTDCCSTREKGDVKDNRGVTSRTGIGIAPVILDLFFQSRGVVDITAATEEAAWSDDLNGGLFTRTLVRLLTSDPKELGAEAGEAVSWKRFFPLLQKETQDFFKTWSEKMTARYPNATIRAETQKPHAFFLGTRAAYGAVELENAKSSTLKYKFRWEGQKEWINWELKPGERHCYAVPLLDGSDPKSLPKLEIFREGATRENRLPSLRWDKDSAPKNLTRRYRIKK